MGAVDEHGVAQGGGGGTSSQGSRAGAPSRRGGGRSLRCKQSLLWACVDRCGADGSPLPSGEGSDDRSWALVTSGEALPARTSSRREAAHGAASALEAKITKNAHGWRGESSLRLCGIALSCEPATEVRKCLARGTSPQKLERACEQSGSCRLRRVEPCTPQSLPSWLHRCRSFVHGGWRHWRLMHV